MFHLPSLNGTVSEPVLRVHARAERYGFESHPRQLISYQKKNPQGSCIAFVQLSPSLNQQNYSSSLSKDLHVHVHCTLIRTLVNIFGEGAFLLCEKHTLFPQIYMRISTNHNSLGCEQPSRPRCRIITQCAGRVSANARPLQLRWGDRECGCFMPCTYNTNGWHVTLVIHIVHPCIHVHVCVGVGCHQGIFYYMYIPLNCHLK